MPHCSHSNMLEDKAKAVSKKTVRGSGCRKTLLSVFRGLRGTEQTKDHSQHVLG